MHRKTAVQMLFAIQLFLLTCSRFFLAGADNSDQNAEKLDVIYAVNCGGSEHVDHFGVPYRADTNPDGIASDYGLRWQVISHSHPDDFVLYQTERYSESTFGYDIPLPKSKTSQNYVLVLKFAEVYFNQPGMKVFDVLLNGEHLVVDALDIFERAGGRAAAYDVQIPFRISANKITLLNTGEESDFNGLLRLEFVKTSQDNPKCNAFYVAKGNLEDIPKQVFTKDPLETENRREENEVRSSTDFDDFEEPWSEVPQPAAAVEEDSGIERYFPVIAVLVVIAILTFFLFRM